MLDNGFVSLLIQYLVIPLKLDYSLSICSVKNNKSKSFWPKEFLNCKVLK